MAGGEIVIYPPKGSTLPASKPPSLVTLVWYGATSGHLYAAGTAGERFAVRNSGCFAVVEGTGDHCCEYSWRGWWRCWVKQAKLRCWYDRRFAYVLDLDGDFFDRCKFMSLSICIVSQVSKQKITVSTWCRLSKHVAKTGDNGVKLSLTTLRHYVS